jgi:ABC-type multidrug transport system fused ATPase/permease subunit
MRVQLNSILFAKTLVRKDVASSSGSSENKPKDKNNADSASESLEKNDDEGDFSSKAQIMTLMTTDVDRVSGFSWHMFTLVGASRILAVPISVFLGCYQDSPIEIIVGTVFLYSLLGSSAFVGLAVTCLFLPLNHFAGKIVVGAQENLMKAKDERVALMNEILGAIRMLKVFGSSSSTWSSTLNLSVHGMGAQLREAGVRNQGERAEVLQTQLSRRGALIHPFQRIKEAKRCFRIGVLECDLVDLKQYPFEA